MEKQKHHARSRSCTAGIFASFLKSTTTSFSFASHNKSSFNHRHAFSGPIVSIVPAEARRRKGSRTGYRTPEPASPKVSCIGQIKQRKINSRSKSGKHAAMAAVGLPPKPPESGHPKRSLVQRMFFRRRSRSRARDGCKGRATVAAAPTAGIGQMRRFTSGRGALEDFDWREVERRGGSDGDDYEEEEDEVFVAHSAPLVLGGGVVASEPRKEVNLWRRRPMAAPTPLQVH